LRRRSAPRGADEIEQVGVFGFVELERLTDGLEDALGDSPRVPALEPGVLLDADACDQRHFLAPKPGDSALPAVLREARTFGSDPCAAGRQELADLALDAHNPTIRAPGDAWEVLAIPL
jgi:hypothetical protein